MSDPRIRLPKLTSSTSLTATSVFRYALALLAAATFYYGAARLGLLMATENDLVSMIWLPAGLALATMLYDRRLWPAIFIGALGEALASNLSLAAAFITATTTTATTRVAAGWLRRIGWHDDLCRLQ